jgi:hypothetical protein
VIADCDHGRCRHEFDDGGRCPQSASGPDHLCFYHSKLHCGLIRQHFAEQDEAPIKRKAKQ